MARDGGPPIVCVSFDGCRVHKGMKQTSFGYKFVNMINELDNSPHYFHEFALLERGDDHINLREYAGEVCAQVNRLIDAGVVNGPSGLVEVRIVGCLDFAAMHANAGSGGACMLHGCTYCKVTTPDICCLDPDKIRVGWPRRTLEESAALAHTVPGKCPGCEMLVVDPGDPPRKLNKDKERPLARLRDPPPPRPYRFKDVVHSTLHFNQKPGQTAIIKLQPWKWCICVLHMHLAIVGMLFSKSFLEDRTLDRLVKGQSEGTLAHMIFLMLKTAGVMIKLPHAPQPDVNKFFQSVSKHRFAGSDASNVLTVWPQLMELAYPEEQRRNSEQTRQKYETLSACWRYWAEQLWPLIQNTELDRAAKADQLTTKALEFITLWVKATGGTQNVYLHLLVKHLPEQVRPNTPFSMPCDPWFLQLQSLESKHSWRKKVHLNRTNKHAPKPVRERAQEIVAYFRANGKEVAGHKRSSGKCRGLQALEASVLHDMLFDYFETPESKAVKYRQTEQRRKARHRRLMRAKGCLLTYVTAKGKEIRGDCQVEDDVAEELAVSEEEHQERQDGAGDGAPSSEEDVPEEEKLPDADSDSSLVSVHTTDSD